MKQAFKEVHLAHRRREMKNLIRAYGHRAVTLLPVQLDILSRSVEQVEEAVHDLVLPHALQLHQQH